MLGIKPNSIFTEFTNISFPIKRWFANLEQSHNKAAWTSRSKMGVTTKKLWPGPKKGKVPPAPTAKKFQPGNWHLVWSHQNNSLHQKELNSSPDGATHPENVVWKIFFDKEPERDAKHSRDAADPTRKLKQMLPEETLPIKKSKCLTTN